MNDKKQKMIFITAINPLFDSNIRRECMDLYQESKNINRKILIINNFLNSNKVSFIKSFVAFLWQVCYILGKFSEINKIAMGFRAVYNKML